MAVSGMAKMVFSVAILNGACTDSPTPPPTMGTYQYAIGYWIRHLSSLLVMPSMMLTIGLVAVPIK